MTTSYNYNKPKDQSLVILQTSSPDKTKQWNPKKQKDTIFNQ
jgi:hypothetical protein